MTAPHPVSPGPSAAGSSPGPAAEAGALNLAEKREHTLLSLFELSHALSVSLDPYRISDLALWSLMGHFGTVRSALWLLSEEPRGQAVVIRTHGLHDEVARAIGQGLAPQVADQFTYEQEPIRLETWARSVQAPGAGLAVENGLEILAPVVSHGRLLGMIALSARETGESYTALDLEYVRTASGMVGVAVENTRLYHRMLEANRQLQKANQELSELDKMKSEFLQTVNHELRTPLTVSLGYLGTLVENGGLTPPQRRSATIVQEQIQKLGAMIQSLLDFSSLSTGVAKLELGDSDLRLLLRSYADVRRPGVVERLREFELRLEEAHLAARCDAKRLLQVLDLLVDNAVKFTPLGTHIRLQADRLRTGADFWIRVQVRDNGPGIDSRHLATLFEPFRQVDGSTTRVVGGLGMGLALAREIVEKMGGRLEATSELGVGTTLTLLLRESGGG